MFAGTKADARLAITGSSARPRAVGNAVFPLRMPAGKEASEIEYLIDGSAPFILVTAASKDAMRSIADQIAACFTGTGELYTVRPEPVGSGNNEKPCGTLLTIEQGGRLPSPCGPGLAIVEEAERLPARLHDVAGELLDLQRSLSGPIIILTKDPGTWLTCQFNRHTNLIRLVVVGVQEKPVAQSIRNQPLRSLLWSASRWDRQGPSNTWAFFDTHFDTVQFIHGQGLTC